MEEAKKVLTETLKGMDTFNGRKAGSAVKDKQPNNPAKSRTSEDCYSNPKSLEIFTDKTFKNEIKEAHKKSRKKKKIDLLLKKTIQF